MSFQDLLTSHDNFGSLEFDLMVSLGLIPGVSNFRVAGSGAAVNGFTTCLGDLTTGWSEQAAASKIKISSSSTDDVMTSGTGAWTVKVSGVDANYNKITDIVELNGQTAVNTAETFRFVEEIKVTSAGTGKANAGIIYAGTGDVTTGVPDTKYCAMAVGIITSRQAFAVVPAGYSFVLTDFDGQNAVKETASSSMIYRKDFGGLWERRLSAQLPYGGFAVV